MEDSALKFQGCVSLSSWLLVALMMSVLSNYICLMFSVNTRAVLPLNNLKGAPTLRRRTNEFLVDSLEIFDKTLVVNSSC